MNDMLTNIVLHALILYLIGGVLAFVIMLYRCRKAWKVKKERFSINDMMMVSLLVSWFYVYDVVLFNVTKIIKKFKK